MQNIDSPEKSETLWISRAIWSSKFTRDFFFSRKMENYKLKGISKILKLYVINNSIKNYKI